MPTRDEAWQLLCEWTQTDALRNHGRAVEGAPGRRQFQVRRLDAFVRWLLPLGDAARVVSPAAVRDEYDRQVAATLALYPEPA